MIWYVYPMWHKVSFTLIAERHVEELRKYFRLYTIDELAFPNIYPATKPLVILHPFFYVIVRASKRIERLLARIRGIIGIDVADSDKISNLAVSLTHYAECMVVPSDWARQAYVSSGCKVPVRVVPHGLDPSYFAPPSEIQSFKDLLDLKRHRKMKYMLFFCWHSEYRKGLDLVLKAYEQIRRERKDLVLVAKFMSGNGEPHRRIRHLGGIIVAGWLSEEQKLELYDLCDIYLLFSRGGGFEINGLEAIARGNVVVAADRGPWTEYLPGFCLVPSRPCPWVLKDNPIHCGRGVEVIVDKAVDRILEIADNLDDYKARVREHVAKNVRNRFTWEMAGKRLADIVRTYL